MIIEQEKEVCSNCQQGTIATFHLMDSVFKRSVGKMKNRQTNLLNMSIIMSYWGMKRREFEWFWTETFKGFFKTFSFASDSDDWARKRENQKECLHITAVKRKKKTLVEVWAEVFQIILFHTEVTQPWTNNSKVNLVNTLWYFVN